MASLQMFRSAMKRQCAGGQSKRVNVGLALVSNPRVLFLDEPTSGLDSYTANEVIVCPVLRIQP